MAVSKALLDAFRAELETQAGKASSYASAYLAAMRAMFPDVGVAEVRDAAIEAIRESLSIYGDQAAALAGALFDQLAAEHGYAAGSTVQSVIDDAEIERKVRYFAGSLASGKVEEFDRSVSDLTGYYVKRSAFENMVRNCERNGIRYARVPSGTETCAFCFMLSSRGFVYRSKASAGKNHRTGGGYHLNCDCIVVPGFGDLQPDAQVEGYAPSEMYDRWSQCARTVGVGAEKALGSEELRRAVFQEVKTRDWRWLYTGKVPEVTFENEALKRETEKRRPWEISTAEKLARQGIQCRFVVDSVEYPDNSTGLIQRVGLADFENGYEIKTLNGASSFNTVDGYIKNTSRKGNAVALVFDNSENAALDDEMLRDYIKRSRRFRSGRIYILGNGEALTRIK